MSIDEVKASIGQWVMTTDPGHKLVRSRAPHGPYKLLQITKAGLCVLEGYDDFHVAPSNIQSLHGWKPISEAPKDGTYIMAVPDGFWNREALEGYVPTVCAWSEKAQTFMEISWEDDPDTSWAPFFYHELPTSPLGFAYATLHSR